MKIIALMPVKNEEWILKTTVPQTLRFVDEMLVLDVESSDQTRTILESFGVKVKHQPYHPVNYSQWRQNLLDWGRARGGTHFVFLDADETFTTNLLPLFKERISAMKPGQKLVFDWLCLWHSPFKLRTDNSVWSSNYKDIVFCDDNISNFLSTKLHEGRTPGENNVSTSVRISRKAGAVLHYQFVNAARFQMKQAFQRCREHVLHNATPYQINQKYSITLDSAPATCIALPEEWIDGIQNLENLAHAPLDWYYPAILEYFEKHGINYFEPIQIWHVPELYNEFFKKVGRKPKPDLQPPLQQRIRTKITALIPASIKSKVKQLISGNPR